jgi:O-antigen/teichoic acid export membrane protein
MRNQPVAFAGFELFSAAFVVAISLLLVVGFDQGWQGRMLAIAIASMAGTLIALIWLARQGYLTTEFDRGDLEDAFRFGAGVVPHDLCNQAVRVADRLFLVAMVGLAGAGQYAVASQIASVMLTVLAAFNKAWAPYLFSQLRDARAGTHEAIVKISYLIICCAVLFFLVFNAAVPLLYNLFVDAKFKPSMDYVVWLTLGYVFMAAYMTYVDYIFYVKKTHFLSLITMFNLACNLLLNYLFIKRFGAIGAAYAFAMTMFVVMVMAFLISNRLHPMPWFHWFKKWI